MTTGIFLTNGQWRTYPQGYQWGDNFYCPDHILPQFPAFKTMPPSTLPGKDFVEDLLPALAKNRGIDYSDELSYDSDDFPKAVTNSDEENHCAVCNIDLREV